MTMRIGAALVVALLALAGCEDDGASVRDLGGSASSGSGSGSGSGTAHASGSATEAEAEAEECNAPEPGEPGMTVRLDEYQITPEEDEITRGPARFLATNVGEQTHEFYVAEARSIEGLPLDRKGSVDEEALEKEDRLLAELEAVPAGETCMVELGLDPGTYVMFCNIRENTDGKGVVNHFLQGMRARFKVP